MKIAYISFAHIADYHEPDAWLKKLDFYTRQLEAMTPFAQVVSIHNIQYEGVLVRNKVEYHFLKNSKSELMMPVRLLRYVKNLGADVIIVHGLCFPIQVLLLRIQLPAKKIFSIHHAEKPFRFPKNLMQRLVDRFITGYFFASAELGKIWVDGGLIASQQKVHEVMEVSSVFYPTRSNNDLASIASNYIWVGRLDENKDPLTLVRAFITFLHHSPESKLFLIYREGHLRREIDKMIIENKCNDRIVVIEDVAHDDLLDYYNQAAFVISTSHYEGSGTAVCEGMSCGCIPILTNIPSFRMMTSNGEIGLLYEPADVQGLYNALLQSKKIDKAKERSKVLNQFREKLSCEAITEAMLNVISKS
jgi:glycosyltransferase involved in cell wall biosynthesis